MVIAVEIVSVVFSKCQSRKQQQQFDSWKKQKGQIILRCVMSVRMGVFCVYIRKVVRTVVIRLYVLVVSCVTATLQL